MYNILSRVQARAQDHRKSEANVFDVRGCIVDDRPAIYQSSNKVMNMNELDQTELLANHGHSFRRERIERYIPKG
jgi:hypothetical protein